MLHHLPEFVRPARLCWNKGNPDQWVAPIENPADQLDRDIQQTGDRVKGFGNSLKEKTKAVQEQHLKHIELIFSDIPADTSKEEAQRALRFAKDEIDDFRKDHPENQTAIALQKRIDELLKKADASTPEQR